MKKLILMVVAMVITVGINETFAADQKKPEPKIETTTFAADIDCEKCTKKIMAYLPNKKGIKDVDVDLRRKEVKVTYFEAKSSDAAIIKHLAKIGVKAKKAPAPAPAKHDPKHDLKHESNRK